MHTLTYSETSPHRIDAGPSLLGEIRLISTIRSVRESLATIATTVDAPHRSSILRLVRDIESALHEDDTVSNFVLRFDDTHGGYLSGLARDFPSLTPTELKLCAFLRLPMPSKEVALLFHCSVRSIEKHRERMRKKFRLKSNENLTTFLASRGAYRTDATSIA